MEIVIGILLLVTFAIFLVYAIKGGNLPLGSLIMGTLWMVIALVGKLLCSDAFVASTSLADLTVSSALNDVFQTAITNTGTNMILFFFGAFFGRVLMDTGIVSTLIKKTVELGGDKPVITSILLWIVVAAISTSLFSSGAVVAIGVIVIPILLSLGLNKTIIITGMMLAVGAGAYINVVPFNQYWLFFNDANYTYRESFLTWGAIALAVQLLVTIIYTIITAGKKKKVHAWAAQTGSVAETNRVPGIALITPFLPVIMVIAFDLPVIFAFIASSFFGLAVCGRFTSYAEAARIVAKNFFDGVVDTAPLLCFIMFLQTFNKAAGLCVPYFNAVLGNVIPKSALFICAFFAIFALLGLFRGPLTLAGSGTAILGILTGLGYSTNILFPLFYTTTMTMNISCCVTQSWTIWGLNYAKVENKEYLKNSIPCGWIIVAILCVVTYFMFGSIAF